VKACLAPAQRVVCNFKPTHASSMDLLSVTGPRAEIAPGLSEVPRWVHLPGEK
jgi:hypothetical protein